MATTTIYGPFNVHNDPPLAVRGSQNSHWTGFTDPDPLKAAGFTATVTAIPGGSATAILAVTDSSVQIVHDFHGDIDFPSVVIWADVLNDGDVPIADYQIFITFVLK
jgi:hypothetical protein